MYAPAFAMSLKNHPRCSDLYLYKTCGVLMARLYTEMHSFDIYGFTVVEGHGDAMENIFTHERHRETTRVYNQYTLGSSLVSSSVTKTRSVCMAAGFSQN
jgi:hypothetical protein